MKPTSARYRWLATRLPHPDERRITALTGARQTGKTTLVRALYPDFRYINLDDAEARHALRTIRTSAWARTVGEAVLGEAQKAPAVFDRVKHAFDAGEIDATVLLGSSRFLLLRQIRETLAGRAFLYDLWPLMLSELMAPAEDGEPPRPLLDAVLSSRERLGDVLEREPQRLFGAEEDRRRQALEHLSTWGGMPALLDLDDESRKTWLRSYQQTFLERDLADMVRLRDLQPFRTLQQLAMLRSGQLLNTAELGRDAGLTSSTARNYLEYLGIGYQTVLLRPFLTNLTSRLVKAPKLYWVDLGLLRQGTHRWGRLDGAMFETLVVMECHKWIRTMMDDAELFFYRTRSGREVDLLADTPAGVIGIEIKHRAAARMGDAKGLRAIAKALGDRWRGGLVVYDGSDIEPLVEAEQIWGVPAHRLFATPAGR